MIKSLARCVGMLMVSAFLAASPANAQLSALSQSPAPPAAPVVQGAPPTAATPIPISSVATSQQDYNKRLSDIEQRAASEEKLSAARHDGANLLLALIAILISVVGIMIPAITYLTSVLPSQAIVKDARAALAALEHRFGELSEKYRATQIDRAVSNLTSPDDLVRQAAESALALDPYYPFDKGQIADICDAARPKDSGPLRLTLITILENQRGAWPLRTLVELYESRDSHDRAFVLRALVRHTCVVRNRGASEAVIALLRRAPETDIPTLARAFATEDSPADLIEALFTDEQIWARVSAHTRAHGISALAALPKGPERLTTSALVRLQKGRHFCFQDSQGQPTREEDASRVMVYEDGVNTACADRSDMKGWNDLCYPARPMGSPVQR